MTESFDAIFEMENEKQKHEHNLWKCWSAHKQTEQRAAGDMIKTTHLMQNMSSGRKHVIARCYLK